jgi:hypothetical protein
MSVVEFVEQPDGACIERLQMCPKLSASRVDHQIFARPNRRPQRHSRVGAPAANGRSLGRSVRSVSASTNASNRSS